LWKSFQHKLQTASQFSLGDWLGLVEAWWALLGFSLALRQVNFERLEAFTRLTTEKSAVPADALAWAWRRQRLVSLAARLHLASMTCLPRALTLRWMASRRGIPAQLRIGMNKSSIGMLAHAWVEVQGESIGEPDDIADRFMVLQ
jgi:Transglutaminase-like superfamily